jgi:hypothetical protein
VQVDGKNYCYYGRRAERFGIDGAHVALIDVNSADPAVTRSRLEAAGVTAREYKVNVAVEDEAIAVMDRV